MKFLDCIEINPTIKLEKGKEYSFIEMANVDIYSREPKLTAMKKYTSGVKFEKGDTVIARIEPCLQNGKGFFAKNIQIGFGSTEFLVFRPKNEKIDTDFLYYLMQTDNIRKTMIGSMTGATGRQRVNNDVFNSIEISLPDVEVQKKIGSILSSYDDLIENNKNQIKLLEESALRLYKEWFVRLRFPGYEKAKITDGVPEGWSQATFGDLCQLIKDSCPFKDIAKGTPYIGLEHIPRRSMCLEKWGYSEEVSSNKYRYKEYDILFGKIRPYFHKVGFTINDGVCSTDAMVFRSNENMFELLITTAFSDSFVQHSYATSREGSKMPRADWNEMRAYSVLIPTDDVLIEFNNRIRQYIDLISIKVKQNHNLIESRDKLLPKLMNGDIEISSMRGETI